MKKAIKAFGLSILVIVGVILFGVCLVIMLPFDYLKYKRSAYYRKERKKYRFFAASGWHFALYNEILKYDLPLRFVENPEDPDLECGWFVFEDILFLPYDFYFEFNEESRTWQYCGEDGDETPLTLEEYIEKEIAQVNEITGQDLCKEAVLLLDGSEFEDLENAKAEKRFLIYEDNRPEAVKQFCENVTKWRKNDR